jgi:glucokinase
VVDKGFRMLGASAASICSVVAPDCVVLGGGVVEALGHDILPVFKSGFEKNLFGFDPSKIELRLASLGDSAVAVGATILARKEGKV